MNERHGSSTWIGDPYPNMSPIYPSTSPFPTIGGDGGTLKPQANISLGLRVRLTIEEVNRLKKAALADAELREILKKFANLIDVSVDL